MRSKDSLKVGGGETVHSDFTIASVLGPGGGLITDQKELDLAHIRLKSLFKHPQHDVLNEQFDLLLRRRRMEFDLGIVIEMQGIVLVGGSGSGKSTSVRQMFKSYPDDISARPGKPDAEILSFELPGKGGLKGADVTALFKIGRPRYAEADVAAFLSDMVSAIPAVRQSDRAAITWSLSRPAERSGHSSSGPQR